jgi:hypothetical protein
MSEPKTLVGIEARLLETLFADDQPRVRLSARETLRAALTEARDLGRAEERKALRKIVGPPTVNAGMFGRREIPERVRTLAALDAREKEGR